MTTSTEKLILVPVRVDAFIFNSQSYFHVPSTDPADEAEHRAIIAPITAPDYRNLRLESDLIQHDIFGSIDIRDIDLNGSYVAPRLWSCYPPTLNRELVKCTRDGLYLHWSLPKMYRQGMSATPSAKPVHERETIRHGFKRVQTNSDIEGASSATPVFRPVPDRWLVVRHVENGRFARETLLSDGQLTKNYINPPSSGGSKVFVVESNRVRHIEEIPPHDDLLTTTSAYIDPSQPLDKQGEMFLGCSSSLQDWVKDIKSDPKYIPLTVVTTGNPFFADYQQHNTSVFSFYDDLTARPGDPEYQANAITSLETGNVSYTIMGYHSTVASDPLMIDPMTPEPVPSPEERLKMCSLAIKDKITGFTPQDSDWLVSPKGAQMRALCHGNALSIDWNAIDPNSQPPNPADRAQGIMTKSQPVAVGTNPIDALLGWVSVAATSGRLPVNFSTIEKSLLKIQTLVQNTDDSVDSQLEAAELIGTNNFIRHSGGTLWHLKKDPSRTSLQETNDALTNLREINLLQRMLDAYLTESAQLKINLFEEFWKYVVDRNLGTEEEKSRRKEFAKNNVASIVSRLEELGTSATEGKEIFNKILRIDQRKSQIDCEPGVMPPFIMQQDPTILFAGIPFGRDEKSSGESLGVRLGGQEAIGLDDPGTNTSLKNWAQMIDGIGKTEGLQDKISLDLIGALASLLKEAAWLSANKQGSVPQDESIKKGLWDHQQAWYPLFVEWTVEYYHIPIDDWDFDFQRPEGQNRYGIKSGKTLFKDSDIQSDFRILSGRSPILQQASNSIQTLLQQLFSRANPKELDEILTPDQRKDLLKDIPADLTYFSATMDGFTDQLITRKRGTHLQPNSLLEQGTLKPLQEAIDVGQDIGLDYNSIALMDVTAPYTPFASLTPIPADPAKFSPFKACTHGQFRFTKLLVVDKFGQVITPVNVFRPSDANPICPCPSENYSLETLSDGTPNAVLLYDDPKVSGFVQLPPTMNQPARINSDYVTYDIDQRGWRATDEWENPVSGWIVVNYPDYSIQVFDQAGHFIREFQVMNGSVVSYPFEPSKTLPENVNPTLCDLMTKLGDPGFLEGLFNTLCAAAESVKHPPNAYAETMMSILGRPLAVVQMGFSIELANAPLVNQSTIAPLSSDPITSYNISMKLGDKDNTLDGLVGYFKLEDPDKPQFNMNSFFSYFAPPAPKAGDPSVPISSPFSLKPYYLNPGMYNQNERDYSHAHDHNRQVIAAIVDPFVSVHAYTEMLPTKVLSLPPWVISSGINRVSTFYRMGPLLVPGDPIPEFDQDKEVNHDYQLDEKNIPETTGKIPVPVALKKDDWVWLQPFWLSQEDGTDYNFLDIDEEGPMQTSPWNNQDNMPCTAVEGYLQMRKPFASGEKQ